MKYCLLFCWLFPFGAFAQSSVAPTTTPDLPHPEERLIQEYRDRWVNASAYTLEVAAAMPADQYDYRPTEDQMSFGAQLLHLTGNMVWIANSFLGHEDIELDAAALRKTLRAADATDKEQVIALTQQGLTYVQAALDQLDPTSLEDVQDFFAGPLTRRHLLILLNDHLTHHRAQAIVYLRLRGVEPPRYRGW